MQGSLIYIVMPVVIVLALFVLIALPFAGARDSGHSRSGGMPSRGLEYQGQILSLLDRARRLQQQGDQPEPRTAPGHSPRP